MTAKDPLVVFTPSGKRGRFPVGTPLLAAARTLGVDVDSVCGGRGICGRCQVLVAEGEFAKHGVRSGAPASRRVSETEQRYAKRRGLPSGHRLSCSTPVQGDVVVDVPPGSQVHRQVVRKDADAREIKLNPVVRLHYVEVREPDMHDPSGDLRRLFEALEREWKLTGLGCDFAVLGELQAALRKGEWKVTVAVHDASQVIARVAGLPRQGLRHGRRRRLDDRRGAPVRPRDRRAGRRRGHDEPADPLRRGPDEPGLVRDDEPGRGAADDRRDPRRARRARRRARARAPASRPTDILELTLVGNPIMHHLVLGIDPVELGGAPFALAVDRGADAAGVLARHRRAPERARLRAALHRRARRRRRRRHDPRRAPGPRLRRSRCSSTSAPTPRSCSATASGCSPARARPAPPSRARRSAAASAPRRAPSSACASIRRRSSRASR